MERAACSDTRPCRSWEHRDGDKTACVQQGYDYFIYRSDIVIFIDEVDESALDIADWKILTQGGYSVHDVKYQTAKAFMNKCPMLVTAQHELNFAANHQPAVDRRLCT